MFNNSGPLTEIKLISASLAIAFANKVFPQPGGPHNNTPLGADKPSNSHSFACLIGA